MPEFVPIRKIGRKRGKRGKEGGGGGGIGADINYSKVVQRGKYRLDALTFNEVASCVRRKRRGGKKGTALINAVAWKERSGALPLRRGTIASYVR